jgi:hypothetical protein
MASQFPPKLKPVTWSHIQMCRLELERLRGVILELNNYIEKSRKYLEEASAFVKRGDSSPPKALPPPGGGAEYRLAGASEIEFCRDRAQENRVLAKRVSDPQLKKVLLEIADSYDRLAGA